MRIVHKFSGISYIKVPMSESLTIEEDMTISFWMLPEAPENDEWQNYQHTG